MGLETIEAEISTTRARAADQSAAYNRAISEINADTSLSDTGKSELKAQEYEATRQQVSALRATEESLIDAAIASRKARIEAPARPGPGQIVEYRDAQDRADRLEDADEATRILERALRQNDLVLAHAIFDRALRDRWTTTVNTFTTAKPELRQTVTELKQLLDFKADSMGRTMHYGIFRP